MKAKIVFKVWRHFGQHPDVRSGAEKLIAVPGDDNYMNVVIHPRIKNPAIQLLHHLIAVSVRRRIVERHKRNAVDN